jgi:hypothetical protein
LTILGILGKPVQNIYFNVLVNIVFVINTSHNSQPKKEMEFMMGKLIKDLMMITLEINQPVVIWRQKVKAALHLMAANRLRYFTILWWKAGGTSNSKTCLEDGRVYPA